MLFPEELLHFIWRFRLFRLLDLKTVAGDVIQILHPGQLNSNAGPDFEYASIRIGDALWSGSVELHVESKSWDKHQHQNDPRYNNTILHVVWEGGQQVLRMDGTSIPTLALKQYAATSMLEKYRSLMDNLNWIPCQNQMRVVNAIVKLGWMDRMLIERLENKYDYHYTLITEYKQDWEKIMAVSLGRAFGMKVNAQVFESLMLRIDLSLFQKYQNDHLKISSLLFGGAGMLENDFKEEFPNKLKAEYAYLRHIHQLKPIRAEEWKYLRMRPPNFPSFRLAQLATLYTKQAYWFNLILEGDLHAITLFIRKFEMDAYWMDHYRLGVVSAVHSTDWSESFVTHLFINCFIPLIFSFGKFNGNQLYVQKAIDWLLILDPEINATTKRFAEIGLKSSSAAQSQAILHLKQRYCDEKKCLQCAIGTAILKN